MSLGFFQGTRGGRRFRFFLGSAATAAVADVAVSEVTGSCCCRSTVFDESSADDTIAFALVPFAFSCFWKCRCEGIKGGKVQAVGPRGLPLQTRQNEILMVPSYLSISLTLSISLSFSLSLTFSSFSRSIPLSLFLFIFLSPSR